MQHGNTILKVVHTYHYLKQNYQNRVSKE